MSIALFLVSLGLYGMVFMTNLSGLFELIILVSALMLLIIGSILRYLENTREYGKRWMLIAAAIIPAHWIINGIAFAFFYVMTESQSR